MPVIVLNKIKRETKKDILELWLAEEYQNNRYYYYLKREGMVVLE